MIKTPAHAGKGMCAGKEVIDKEFPCLRTACRATDNDKNNLPQQNLYIAGYI